MVAPHGVDDRGQVTTDAFHAWEGDTHLFLKPSEAFAAASVGFVGVSDGLTDLKDGKLDWTYASTGETAGNTMMTGALPTLRMGQSLTRDFVIGFGKSEAEARQALAASNPQQRLVQPQEVAQSVLWLCAAGSDAINGQALAIDGGELAG